MQQERERLSKAREEAQERLRSAQEVATGDRPRGTGHCRLRTGEAGRVRGPEKPNGTRGASSAPGQRQRAPRGERPAQILEDGSPNAGHTLVVRHPQLLTDAARIDAGVGSHDLQDLRRPFTTRSPLTLTRGR